MQSFHFYFVAFMAIYLLKSTFREHRVHSNATTPNLNSIKKIQTTENSVILANLYSVQSYHKMRYSATAMRLS